MRLIHRDPYCGVVVPCGTVQCVSGWSMINRVKHQKYSIHSIRMVPFFVVSGWTSKRPRDWGRTMLTWCRRSTPTDGPDGSFPSCPRLGKITGLEGFSSQTVPCRESDGRPGWLEGKSPHLVRIKWGQFGEEISLHIWNNSSVLSSRARKIAFSRMQASKIDC